MKYYFVIVIALLLVCFYSGSWAEEYYTWTDDDGGVHMSNNPADVPVKKIKKHNYPEQGRMERAADNRAGDYKRKSDDIEYERQHREDQARYDAAKREKAWNKERCEEARKSERRYRHEWINAKSDSNRDYWKSKVDEVDSLCKKADE